MTSVRKLWRLRAARTGQVIGTFETPDQAEAGSRRCGVPTLVEEVEELQDDSPRTARIRRHD